MQRTLNSTLALLLILTACSFNKKEKLIVNPVAEKIETLNKRDSIVNFAKTFLGTTYLYAGNSPETGFDCSGFTNYVFGHFGINLPRSSSEYTNLGKPLAVKDFQIGDILVFYGYQDNTVVGHLGIICEANGMQSQFIHSSSGKANGVTISSLNSDHYSKRFYKCINVLEP